MSIEVNNCPSPNDAECLMVLGMHRSGTSAVARTLSILGAELPRTLMPAQEGNNQTGFWESQALVDAHDELLADAGSMWNDWRRFDLAAMPPTKRLHHKEHIAALLSSEFGTARSFVLKDPRICRFVPLYNEILQERKIAMRAVIPIRNPLAVIYSLRDRDGMSVGFGALLWLRHVVDAEFATRNVARAVLSYEELLNDWRTTLIRIDACLGLKFRDYGEACSPEITSFLSRDYQHHAPSHHQLEGRNDIHRWVKVCYDAMLRLIVDPYDVMATDRLDQVRSEFDQVELAFGGAMFDELRAQREHFQRDREVLDENARQSMSRALASHALIVEELHASVASHELTIERLSMELSRKADEIVAIRDCVTQMQSSRSWRVTTPLRWTTTAARGLTAKTRFVLRVLPLALVRFALRPSLGWRLAHSLHQDGTSATWRRVIHRALEIDSRTDVAGPGTSLPQASPDKRYSVWIRFNSLTDPHVQALRNRIDQCVQELPKISVLMPVYNSPLHLVERAVASVRNQIYGNWELCIVDDASRNSELRAALRNWSRNDSRIRITERSQNGNISRATNDAAAMATGEFLAFLDHDDELTPDALAEVALSTIANPQADYIYSDDDKIDEQGMRFAPQFKPDWSPTLLLSFMYMSHIKVVRKSLFDSLGGFRVGFEGAQDYDFALRMSEKTSAVVHIPKVLYHWRVVPGSTASAGDAKPHSFEAGRRAVAEAMQRRGHDASVVQSSWALSAKIGVFEPRFPDHGPSVAILIPTRNQLELLQACIASLGKTSYENYRIVIIDNESDDPSTLSWLANQSHQVLRVSNPPGSGFNFAHINNEAARKVDSAYLLLLNSDTVVRTPEWLSQMMGYAQMPGVGAVGAKLLFEDETIQHAGIAHGYYYGMAGPTFRNMPSTHHGYLELAKVARECSAVTAACLVTSRELYLKMGGLDANTFAVAYNDVDYCYRLVDAGYRCIYCPTAELYHYEGKSRGQGDKPSELGAFRRRYGQRTDPWLNVNLSRDNERMEVRPYHVPSPADGPVRAVMVSHNLNHEGAPQSQLELVVGLKQQLVLDPIVLSPTDGPLRLDYQRAGVPVQIIPPPLSNVGDAAALSQRLDQLAATFHEVGAEVVYCNTLQTFWAIAAAERAQIPTIWNVRESEPWQTYFDWLPLDLRAIAYKCLSYPYRVIFVAEATRQGWAPTETAANFTVIHNGLDLARFGERMTHEKRAVLRRGLGVAETELMLALIGTVCERKGQLDLVQALALLPEQAVSRLRSFIVGDRRGEYSDRLRQEVERLPSSLRDRIHIVNETADVGAYYKSADVALCTSRIESYPRIILEAMAAGLPLVTTPVFGIREQVRENINALFYEPGDAEALARALLRVLESDDLRARLAINSRSVLDSLVTYPEMLRRYGEIFRESRYSIGPVSHGSMAP